MQQERHGLEKLESPSREFLNRDGGVRRCGSLARLMIADDGGQVLPWVVVMMLVVLGMAALVVDCGHAMVVQRELQASADAAALAAAETMSGSSTTYQTYATNYGSSSGDKNAYTGLTISSSSVTPLCLTTVSGWGISCTTSSGTVTVPNAVSVTQTALVTTFFAGIIGKPTVTVSATSTAAHARPMPYNIALIVDSTLSMNDTDSNCNNLTQEQCALNGVQNLLEGISTSYDHVAMFTFPNVVAGSNSPAGVAITTSGTSQSFGCTSTTPSSQNSIAYWNLGGGLYSPVLKAINTSTGNNSNGSSTNQPQKAYQPPYTGTAWALPYSFPPIPTGTTGYTIPSGSYSPTYQITPFLEDYNTTSGGTTSLATTSNLVKAAGGLNGCGGVAPSSYDGDFGTYYPGALYAAQAALLKEQTTHANSSNVMIILGDGNATAPQYWPSSSGPMFSMPATNTEATTTYGTSTALTTTAFTFPAGYLTASSGGSYPSWVGECGQEVDAAQYAATYTSGGVANNTLVFTIAYGSPASSNSSNCGSDVHAGNHPNITPCQSLQQMATQVSGQTISPYFYSDYTAEGGDAGCQANTANSGTTAIADIYNAIAAKLASARLIPNGTT
jgi:Flp pilus assembly protein TadG